VGLAALAIPARPVRADSPLTRASPHNAPARGSTTPERDCLNTGHHGPVPVAPSLLAELLPTAKAQWEPAAGGESGATVLHDRAGRRYAKVVSSDHAEELAGERDRIDWLSSTGLPGAVVLDWRASDAGACLVTRAVHGVPADRLGPRALRSAWPSVVETLRALHGLPVDQCPFDRRLASVMPTARATVAEKCVNVGFLPVALQSTPPPLILEQLEAALPRRVAQEGAELAVCHGDLCLPNILIDPVTDQVTGLIDLGRLGTADPHVDIALLLATARTVWPDEQTARQAEHDFEQWYGTAVDPERQDFYLRLDALTW
jgi:streptomycin 3"-kinase